jgi:tetratricopeptide (TPR) repeat protein
MTSAYTPLELAQAFISTGEIQDALDALNAHLDAQPNDDEARRLRADVLTRFGDDTSFQAALADLTQLQQPTADDWHKVAILSQKSGDLDTAHEAYRQALMLRPQDERLTEQWMRLYQSQGDFYSAQQLVDSMPHTWRWRSHAAEIYEALGQYQSAYTAYSDALDLLTIASEGGSDRQSGWTAPFEAALRLRRANVCLIQELYTDAEADYQAAWQRIPDDPVIPFKLGVIALLQGHTAYGQALCQQAFEAAPTDIRTEILTELEQRGIDPVFLAPDDLSDIIDLTET